jgi:hypothetical protein
MIFACCLHNHNRKRMECGKPHANREPMPVLRRILFCSRCNFNRWVSARCASFGYTYTKP